MEYNLDRRLGMNKAYGTKVMRAGRKEVKGGCEGRL
jgi:hypothetical protein